MERERERERRIVSRNIIKHRLIVSFLSVPHSSSMPSFPPASFTVYIWDNTVCRFIGNFPLSLLPFSTPTLKSCISLIRTKRRKLGWSEFAFSNPLSSTKGGNISFSFSSLPLILPLVSVSLSHPVLRLRWRIACVHTLPLPSPSLRLFLLRLLLWIRESWGKGNWGWGGGWKEGTWKVEEGTRMRSRIEDRECGRLFQWNCSV